MRCGARVSRVFGVRATGTLSLQCDSVGRVSMEPRFFSRAGSVSPSRGARGVRACVDAMLDQQRALLAAIDDAQYVFHSPLLDGTIGGHTRHSLDHLRKPLETWRAREEIIRYDLRARHTEVELDRHAALAQIDTIRENLLAVATPHAWDQSVDAAFMLSGDGHEFAFASTLSREMAFAVHHAIHHNALVKVLLRHHFPHVEIPDAFGLAPSTLNFNLAG